MLLDDIASYLQTKGIGTVGTDIFKGEYPDSPDDMVAIYETGGFAPPKSWEGDNPTFQIRVRNRGYSLGRDVCETIMWTLHHVGEETLGTTRYLYIWALDSPISLMRDPKQRHEWTMNFACYKERD